MAPQAGGRSHCKLTIACVTAAHQACSEYRATHSALSTPRYRHGRRSGPGLLKGPDIPSITLFDDIDLFFLSYHLLFQSLSCAYQLLNGAPPDHFEEYWLCVPPGSNSVTIVASPILSLLVNFSKPDITPTPYLSHISLFSLTDCFSSSGTHVWAHWTPQTAIMP